MLGCFNGSTAKHSQFEKRIWSEFLNSQACVATNSKLSVLLNFCESSDSSAVQHQNRSSSAEDLTRPLEVRRSPCCPTVPLHSCPLDPTAFPEIPVGSQSNEAEDHDTPHHAENEFVEKRLCTSVTSESSSCRSGKDRNKPGHVSIPL